MGGTVKFSTFLSSDASTGQDLADAIIPARIRSGYSSGLPTIFASSSNISSLSDDGTGDIGASLSITTSIAVNPCPTGGFDSANVRTTNASQTTTTTIDYRTFQSGTLTDVVGVVILTGELA